MTGGEEGEYMGSVLYIVEGACCMVWSMGMNGCM